MLCTRTPEDCIDSEFWYSLVPSSCLSHTSSSAESFIRMTIRFALCATTWHLHGFLLGRWSIIQAWVLFHHSNIRWFLISYRLVHSGGCSGLWSLSWHVVKGVDVCWAIFGDVFHKGAWVVFGLLQVVDCLLAQELPCVLTFSTFYLALLPLASCGFLCCIPNRWHCLAWTKFSFVMRCLRRMRTSKWYLLSISLLPMHQWYGLWIAAWYLGYGT